MLRKFRSAACAIAALAAVTGLSTSAAAGPFTFSTGNPDGRMAAASRPDSAGSFEIETADDFDLTAATNLTNATFTGIIPRGSSVQNIVIEIYRVFPNDSDTSRTSGPPTFSTPQVPTRVNSPSDNAFAVRDASAGGLSFTMSLLSSSFSALNSVQPGGIQAFPNQTTLGNGPVSGQEVEFDIDFSSVISLAADHYFFVPQVQLDNGDFFWLSAPRPIGAPGTPFPAGVNDLQGWTRDASLDPDWLRVGTDIVGGSPAPTFNFTFSLTGKEIVPEPMTLSLFGAGMVGLVAVRRRKRAIA
jgi:PEP-CTERM motif